MSLFEIIGALVVVLVFLAVVLDVAFEKGWIGLSQERIDKIHAQADELQAKLEAKMLKKAPAPVVKSKTDRLAENAVLLQQGLITREDMEAAKAKILAEP